MPPGRDDWASAVYGNPSSEYGYVLNQNQTYHVYQHRPRDYGTDVHVRLTDRFIRGAAPAHRPFFAYLSVYAPHQLATAARGPALLPARGRAPHAELRPGRHAPPTPSPRDSRRHAAAPRRRGPRLRRRAHETVGFVEHAAGERQLSDLRHDPDEMHDFAGTRRALQRTLARRVAPAR